MENKVSGDESYSKNTYDNYGRCCHTLRYTQVGQWMKNLGEELGLRPSSGTYQLQVASPFNNK